MDAAPSEEVDSPLASEVVSGDGAQPPSRPKACPSSLAAKVDPSSATRTADSSPLRSDTDPSAAVDSVASSAIGEPRQAPPPLAAPRGVRGLFRGEEAYADYQPMDLDCLPASSVLLNVYDVGAAELVQKINRWGTMNDRVLLGGVFHVGVQAYGHEYSYGFIEHAGDSGVCDCPPRCNPQHTYKCTVDLGVTERSEDAVSALVQQMAMSALWEGCVYDLLHHNCLHFARALCTELGVRRMPNWLDRFGRAAVRIQNVTEQLTDNWGRAKQVANDTAKDFRIVKQLVREAVPGVRASIVRWGSGLFARSPATPPLAENEVAVVDPTPMLEDTAKANQVENCEDADAFLLLNSAADVIVEAPHTPTHHAESQRW